MENWLTKNFCDSLRRKVVFNVVLNKLNTCVENGNSFLKIGNLDQPLVLKENFISHSKMCVVKGEKGTIQRYRYLLIASWETSIEGHPRFVKKFICRL
jgi:hypothetical protein